MTSGPRPPASSPVEMNACQPFQLCFLFYPLFKDFESTTNIFSIINFSLCIDSFPSTNMLYCFSFCENKPCLFHIPPQPLPHFSAALYNQTSLMPLPHFPFPFSLRRLLSFSIFITPLNIYFSRSQMTFMVPNPMVSTHSDLSCLSPVTSPLFF